jgi:predicted Zn-dependent protease
MQLRDRRRRAAAVLAAIAAVGCGADPTAGPLRDEATLYGRAVTASQAGDHATAIGHLDALVAAADRPEYRLARGLEHLRSGDAARAKADAEAGLALDPDATARKDLQWLAAEAVKPGGSRLPGQTPSPPSWNK